MEQYDVAIVGAGLAGLQCASLLGRQGARVLLVDRKLSVDAAIQTTGIFVRRTLEDFTFPEDCLGPPVRHVTLYSPARRALELESHRHEFRVGRMDRLYRHYLHQCLQRGIIWSPGTQYVGWEPTRTGSILRLLSKSHARGVHARYIVGADGTSSRVAHDLGLGKNREWIVGLEEVLLDLPLHGPPRFHCFLDPALAPGYLAWLVHDGEEVHLGVGGYASRFNPVRALETFRSCLSAIVDLRGARRRERRAGRIPVGGVHRRLVNHKGLLVGDAAGAPSPLTAGGLDPCMRLSSLAARVIGDYLKTGKQEALSPYSARFRSRFISRLWMRRLLAAMERPGVLELGCGILRLPAFRCAAWSVFFGHGSFPDVDLAPGITETENVGSA